MFPSYIVHFSTITSFTTSEKKKDVVNVLLGIAISNDTILLSEQNYNIRAHNKNNELNLCMVKIDHNKEFINIDDFEINMFDGNYKCITENHILDIDTEIHISKHLGILYPNIPIYKTKYLKCLLNGGILLNDKNKICGMCFKINKTRNYSYFLPSTFIIKYINNIGTKICGLAIDFTINNDNQLQVVNNHDVEYGNKIENESIILSIDGIKLNKDYCVQYNNIFVPIDSYVALKYEVDETFTIETNNGLIKLKTRSVESYLGVYYDKRKEIKINNAIVFELSIQKLCELGLTSFTELYNNYGKKRIGCLINDSLHIFEQEIDITQISVLKKIIKSINENK